ncbi:response regulator transcription factor [Burkholderia ubonensis]|uniref:response regulator transcription factor n=1 Tax=Burkholderia ubonensis TaxID=101571 RepID=UPI00358E4139
MIIALIDGDEDHSQATRSMLVRAGYQVNVFHRGEHAMRNIVRQPPNVTILETRLPDISGLEILAWIRKNFSDMAVIVLSCAIFELDITAAFNAGADDYVIKPAREGELLARILSMTKRRNLVCPETIRFGPYSIATGRKEVYLEGQRISLSRIEYELIELLAKNIGKPVSREVIVNQIWQKSLSESTSGSLDTHIYRLRRRLDLLKREEITLRTIYTIGYQLDYHQQQIDG